MFDGLGPRDGPSPEVSQGARLQVHEQTDTGEKHEKAQRTRTDRVEGPIDGSSQRGRDGADVVGHGISVLVGGFLQHQARVMRAEVFAQTREQGLAVAIVEELDLVDDLSRRILGHVAHTEQYLPSTMPFE